MITLQLNHEQAVFAHRSRPAQERVPA